MELNDLFGLAGKRVVVTGAGSGMGRSAARLLVDLGADVYATVRRHPLDFAVAREIPSELGSKEGLDALLDELPSSIDALFVCHGISNAPGMTNGLEVQLTNFLSFRYLTEALLPRMNEDSSVTFISSNGGWEWRERAAACLELFETDGWEGALASYESHPELTNDGPRLCEAVPERLRSRQGSRSGLRGAPRAHQRDCTGAHAHRAHR